MEGVAEQLDRERRQRPLAAAGAALAGLLTFAGSLYAEVSLANPPRVWVLDSLQRIEGSEPVGPQPSLLQPYFRYVEQNVGTLIVGALMTGAGLILLALVMRFLAQATQARANGLSRLATLLPPVGAVVFTVGLVMAAMGAGEHYERLGAAGTVDAVQATEAAWLLVTGQSIHLAGALALGMGVGLICLHAMRVGLLTRFLGVLGILVGVILGFSPFLGNLGPVQMVWLLALALLLAGRWPGGDPLAWANGVAVPWPSPAEVREARERAGREDTPSAPKPERATGGPSPATSARKKRKKRG